MGFPVLISPFWHFAKGKKSKQKQALFLISAIVLYFFYSLVPRRGNFNYFFLFFNKINVYNSILYGKPREAKNKTEGRVKVDGSSRACKWNEMNFWWFFILFLFFKKEQAV